MRYINAAVRSIEANGYSHVKPLVFYLVRAIERGPTDEGCLFTWNILKAVMGRLTPRELMEIFPVDKRFDGVRWSELDYFTTMDLVRKHGRDVPLCEAENLTEFLMEYQNSHIRKMLVKVICAISEQMRRERGYGVWEKACAHFGIPYRTQTPDGEFITHRCRELPGTDIIYEEVQNHD